MKKFFIEAVSLTAMYIIIAAISLLIFFIVYPLIAIV